MEDRGIKIAGNRVAVVKTGKVGGPYVWIGKAKWQSGGRDWADVYINKTRMEALIRRWKRATGDTDGE